MTAAGWIRKSLEKPARSVTKVNEIQKKGRGQLRKAMMLTKSKSSDFNNPLKLEK